MIRLAGFGVVALSFATGVIASPVVSLPINSQVPPLAIVAEPYDFVFAESTFASSSGSLSYSLSEAPAWLRLESASRTFSGTPGNADNGTVTVVLTATDGSGSTDSNATFIVTSTPQPRLVDPIASQISSFGNRSDADTLSLYPEASFDFSFSQNTFTSADGSLNYYAISPNNTPLPSWVTFDGASLRFSGTTPPLSALDVHPQTFGVKLIASNVLGFGGTEAFFNLTVGEHELFFKSALMTVNVTEGGFLNVTNLRDQLILDGSSPSAQDLVDVSAQSPDWVTFDNSSFSLSGQVPPQVMPSNATITARDIHGDTASTIVSIMVPSSLFTKAVGKVNATIGEDFSYDLRDVLASTSNVNVAVDIDPALTWLKYHSSTFVLDGKVPNKAKTGNFNVGVTATSTGSSQSNTQNLTISLRDDDSGEGARSTISASPSGTASGSRGGPSSAPAASARRASPSKGTIAAAVVVPILILLIVVAFLICCCRRRRSSDQVSLHDSPKAEPPWPGTAPEELWPSADRPISQVSDEPQRLPALNAILMEGLGLRFSRASQQKNSPDTERGANSPYRSPQISTPFNRSPRAGGANASPRLGIFARSARNSGLGISHSGQRSKDLVNSPSEVQQSPRKKVAAANRLLAMYSTEWTDETGSSGQFQSCEGGSEMMSDEEEDEESETASRGSTRSPNRSSLSINRTDSIMEPGRVLRAYAASNSFRAHGPPRSKTGRTPPPAEVFRRSQDTERNRLLRQVQGRSPFFGGSGRTSIRTSFVSRRSSQSRSRRFMSQDDSPTLPRPTVPPERPNPLFSSFLKEPSEHPIPEIDSPNLGAGTSPDLPPMRERPRSRNIASRLSDRFSRLSHQLSNVSNRLPPSPRSSPSSQFNSRFIDYVDDSGQRQWRARAPTDTEPGTSPWIGMDSHGNSFEFSDGQEIEYGMAVQAPPSSSSEYPPSQSQRQSQPSPSPSPAIRPPARASVASTTRGVPRLVEFRAKRPVSVDSGTPTRPTRESSHSGSYAFI